MKRSLVLILLSFIILAGCGDGSTPTSSVLTSALVMNTGVYLSDAGLGIRVDVYKMGSRLRLSSGDHLYAYINSNRYSFSEEYSTTPYSPDRTYFYILNLPVISGGTVVRVALERDNGVSASNNIVRIPLVPTITNPPANTTLSYTQDNYFSWFPGWPDDDLLMLSLTGCCDNPNFPVDVAATQYIIPAGTMYQLSSARQLTMTVLRRRLGSVDGNLNGGTIQASALSQQILWLQN